MSHWKTKFMKRQRSLSDSARLLCVPMQILDLTHKKIKGFETGTVFMVRK